MDYLRIVEPGELAREHEEIIKAIEADDTKRVADHLSSHATRLVEYLIDQKAADNGWSEMK